MGADACRAHSGEIASMERRYTTPFGTTIALGMTRRASFAGSFTDNKYLISFAKRQMTTQAADKRETGHLPVMKLCSKQIRHLQAAHCFDVFLVCWWLGEIGIWRMQVHRWFNFVFDLECLMIGFGNEHSLIVMCSHSGNFTI